MPLEDFELISKIGQGTYSQVYLVKRLSDNIFYALKKVHLVNLSDKEKENALNEIRLLASIKSRYVVSFREAFFDNTGEYLCIVMSYADRGDLQVKIDLHKANGTSMDENQILKIFSNIVKGLQKLHEFNIFHRDIKSANIFLFSDGTAKLGDMNVSKICNKNGMLTTQTGTPYYASPEVWGNQPYDQYSDIWSLGCVLYEMITLKTPFKANSLHEIYKQIVKANYTRIPSDYSKDLQLLVKLLLQPSPLNRPSCASILQLQLFKGMKIKKDIEDQNDSILLKTIKISNELSNSLPMANYKLGVVKKNKLSEISSLKSLGQFSFDQSFTISPKYRQKKRSKTKLPLILNNSINREVNRSSSVRQYLKNVKSISKEKKKKILEKALSKDTIKKKGLQNNQNSRETSIKETIEYQKEDTENKRFVNMISFKNKRRFQIIFPLLQ